MRIRDLLRRLATLGLACGLLGIGGLSQRGSVALAAPAPEATESGAEAWALLAQVRDQLRAGSPLAAEFEQSFVPSGFSSGDTESGTLFVDLPKCLRFEYHEPFPKNFLLCGDWVYTWNPGEPSGRRFLVDDSEAEGIDLLRLEVETLKNRYRAEIGDDSGSLQIIRLTPKDAGNQIREARVELERNEASGTPRRLRALSYEDQSGNQTRFEISATRRLETKAELQAPALDWLED